MCAIFPRDRKQCTSRPVCIKPSEAFAISVGDNQKVNCPAKARGMIASAMPSDDSIVKDELLVTIFSPDVPELELVDLLGIREYPPERCDMTKQIL